MLEDALGPAPTPLPWLWSAAARIAGEDPQTLGQDAGAVTRSLSLAADLFDLPAVCTSFDTVREAEALGCAVTDDAVVGFVDSPDAAFEIDVTGVVASDRVQTTLDATERLAGAVRADVLGGITGPATLTDQLLDGAVATHHSETIEETLFAATDACVELVNAHLDRGADGIALLEPGGVSDLVGYVEVVSSVANVLSHYETDAVVITDQAADETIDRVGALGLAVVTGGVDDPEKAMETAAGAGVTLGIGVPAETFVAGPDELDRFREALPQGSLASSAWTVPEAVAPETLHRLMGTL